MKPHYFICFEGGASGNFIALLIRALARPEYINEEKNIISPRGSCDAAAAASDITYKYANFVMGHNIYPESDETLAVIMNAIADPDNTYKKVSESELDQFDFDITSIHYTSSRAINSFLKNQHVYVILITITEEDVDLVATNHVYKNVDDLPISTVDDIIAGQKKILLDKIKSSDYINVNNILHDRLFKLPFNLIYSDHEKILKMLSNITNLEINESARQLYKDYMSAQQLILTRYKL
jgi:hypothetical protein